MHLTRPRPALTPTRRRRLEPSDTTRYLRRASDARRLGLEATAVPVDAEDAARQVVAWLTGPAAPTTIGVTLLTDAPQSAADWVGKIGAALTGDGHNVLVIDTTVGHEQGDPRVHDVVSGRLPFEDAVHADAETHTARLGLASGDVSVLPEVLARVPAYVDRTVVALPDGATDAARDIDMLVLIAQADVLELRVLERLAEEQAAAHVHVVVLDPAVSPADAPRRRHEDLDIPATLWDGDENELADEPTMRLVARDDEASDLSEVLWQAERRAG